MISVCFQGKPFTITAIQVHAQTSDAKDAAIDKFHEELQDFLEQT